MLFQPPSEAQLWLSKAEGWGGCFGFPNAQDSLSASALSAPLPLSPSPTQPCGQGFVPWLEFSHLIFMHHL